METLSDDVVDGKVVSKRRKNDVEIMHNDFGSSSDDSYDDAKNDIFDEEIVVKNIVVSVAKNDIGHVIDDAFDDDEDNVYKMNHGRRGLALIFNHFLFESKFNLGSRTGTHVDRDNLKSVLFKMRFDVQVYDDLTCDKLMEAVTEAASLDHTDADCFLLVILR